MRKQPLKSLGSCFMGLTLAASMVPMAAGTAAAADDSESSAYWSAPTQAATVDTSKILKTYGVRAGSAGPDFVGISNTNYDFSGQTSPSKYAGVQYTEYTADSLQTTAGAGLAIWATSVNENPNPFYANLMYNATTGGNAYQATTWVDNPETSSWGDSNNASSTRADGSSTIAGLEYSPEIIFGANKTTNWSNLDASDTNIGKAAAEDANYNPTFMNNDSTNLWTQVYTINALGVLTDSLKEGVNKDMTTRYDNDSATTGALSYEKALRGNLLWIASQIDANKVQKKTVAYLYAIDDNGTGYFFIPEADGLLTGDDTGKTTTSAKSTPDTNYAANNGTIDLDYMDTLPFITNTFKNGEAVEGGIVMKCEDIWKSNPAVKVTSDKTSALEGVDVIIYNGTTVSGDKMQGTSGGKNSSGVNNAAALTTDSVQTWAKSHGFTGTQVIKGDDYGTSTNQGFGTVEATEDGMSPMLYCQRNYTTDKPARAAWAYSQVYPELYPNADASYAYWVDTVYHVNTENVGTVVKYMTNQSDDVVYNEEIARTMEDNFYTGLLWWVKTGSKSETWSKYAYYNGSSRASYYSYAEDYTTTDSDGKTETHKANNSNPAASEEGKDTIGIFEPSTTWETTVPSAGTYRLAGNSRYDTMSEIVDATYVVGTTEAAVLATGENFPDALTASSVAGNYDCPVLLTETNELSSQAANIIKELELKTVYIMGGVNSVSSEVEKAVEDLGAKVVRIAGADRQATSLEAMKQLGDNTFDTVIIAAGSNYADSLSVSPYAYLEEAPIVLANGDGVLTDDAVNAIKAQSEVKNIVIVGGENSVADTVKTQLGEGYTYNRLGGADRYETSSLVANWELTKGMTVETAAIADGRNFPDALAGAAMSGSLGSVLLLVSPENTSNATQLLAANANDVLALYVYGGENSVPADVVSACAASAGLPE